VPGALDDDGASARDLVLEAGYEQIARRRTYRLDLSAAR
jgi:hypothetical protein